MALNLARGEITPNTKATKNQNPVRGEITPKTKATKNQNPVRGEIILRDFL